MIPVPVLYAYLAVAVALIALLLLPRKGHPSDAASHLARHGAAKRGKAAKAKQDATHDALRAGR